MGKVSASISIFDIAGLVKGASSGAGLGNAFLSHIDAVDGIYHMVRAFPNEEMLKINKPIRDGEWNYKEIEFLNGLLFMTAKPVVYLINIGYDEYKAKKNKFLPKIAAWIKENGGGPMLPFSAEFEKEVM